MDKNEKTIKVEPYWNVKYISSWKYRPQSAIKVEPYWNVKAYGPDVIAIATY